MEISISDEFSGAVLQVWRALSLFPPTLQARALLQSWTALPSYLRTQAGLRADGLGGSLSERTLDSRTAFPELRRKGPRAGLTEYPPHLLFEWCTGPGATPSTETASLASNPTILEGTNPSQLLPASPDLFSPGLLRGLLQFPDLELSCYLSSPHGHISCPKSWLSGTKPS